MQLSVEQKREFYDRGFVKVPGVIPRVMVDAALRAINHSVGEGMDHEDMTQMRSQTYAREITDTPVITGLFNATPMRDLAMSAIGPITPVTGGQIALRFPSTDDPPGQPGGHLDGMHSPHNGVPAGQISNFTMLCGVLLSELREPNSGNFTVYPGTHHLYEDYFRKHSPQSLLDGMPPVDLPDPEQVTAQPGDAVFVHYQLAHTAAPNVSPHVRYAIFFRLKHVQHDEFTWEAMTDIWKTWDGMREIVAEHTHG
jgi:hypothetical protein